MNLHVSGKYLKNAIFLLLFLLILAFVLVKQINNITTTTDSTEPVSEEFINDTAVFGELLESENSDAALLAAQDLIKNAQSDIERGRATLSLALAERETDIIQATKRFKQISLNEAFHPTTRAFAMWYTLERYFGTRDVVFADEYIYTGPMWETFVDEAYASNPGLQYRVAAINALQATLDQEIIIQPTMRLAAELASLVTYNQFSQEYKSELVNQIKNYISLGDNLIVDLEDNYYYDGTEYLVLVSALNSKALALDKLYSAGYIDDITMVTNAYEEAITAIIDNNITSDHGFFTRYNYADFLARNGIEENKDTIISVLAPMSELNKSDTGVALAFFVSRLNSDEEWTRSESFSGHPKTMQNLIEVSSEFASAIQTFEKNNDNP